MKASATVKFGLRVKKIRHLRGFSQEHLAEKAQLHRTYIGMIERGEKNITLKNIYRIAKGLGVEIIELF